MARVWSGKEDVDQAVGTIARCIKETGNIPEPLLEACWKTIERSSHGLIQRFYQKLSIECPEALRYFMKENEE